ncbi:hypothetical protein ACWGMA_43340 [Streptomyces asiaticus]
MGEYGSEAGEGAVEAADGGVLAPLSMAAVTVIAVPAGPAAAVPPGGYAFVANLGSDTVSMINTSTDAVTTVGVGRGPVGVAVSPDGSRAYVTPAPTP